MNIILATGIYPPDIGGPSTYTSALEKELRVRGHAVTVVTYGRVHARKGYEKTGNIVRVSHTGCVVRRWLAYRSTLRAFAYDADVVIAMSSVSVGVPLLLSGLKKPRKILRLGGDFFWERYTDGRGLLSLEAWYRSRFGFWRLMNRFFMRRILASFDALVYSTEFQKKLHERSYKHLPPRVVIENAVPTSERKKHLLHHPLRLLFIGRLVRFKRVNLLLEVLASLLDARLTITGDGPEKKHLQEQVRLLGLSQRVTFHPSMHGDAKKILFAEHDLLILPSVTEISPNVALEAVSAGLPVLLSASTGLSEDRSRGMFRAPMDSATMILTALMHVQSTYTALQSEALLTRPWSVVTDEWVTLLHRV